MISWLPYLINDEDDDDDSHDDDGGDDDFHDGHNDNDDDDYNKRSYCTLDDKAIEYALLSTDNL
jgi:hypothetical protein